MIFASLPNYLLAISVSLHVIRSFPKKRDCGIDDD